MKSNNTATIDKSIEETLNRIIEDAGLNEELSKEEKLKAFGKNLEKYRLQKGLSKNKISAMAGIIPQTYYRYANGTQEPGVVIAAKLADIYGVDVQDLFEGMDSKRLRIKKAVRDLNDFGIKAEPSLSGQVAVTVNSEQPYYLPVDIVEKLIQETINNIKPTIDTVFLSEFTKNFLLYMSPKK